MPTAMAIGGRFRCCRQNRAWPLAILGHLLGDGWRKAAYMISRIRLAAVQDGAGAEMLHI